MKNSRSAYYEQMCELALSKREEYKIDTSSLGLRIMRRIYKSEGIDIVPWEFSHRIRAIYCCEDDDLSVAVNLNLPPIPRLFSLAHELKHHYEDQEKIKDGQLKCGDWNENELIEKGAEVFAAEFIYPELEMLELINQLNITKTNCSPEKIVQFKKICPATVSYSYLVKRFERFDLCEPKEYKSIKFQNLEEEILAYLSTNKIGSRKIELEKRCTKKYLKRFDQTDRLLIKATQQIWHSLPTYPFTFRTFSKSRYSSA
jgi:Zn-dependent peptidase ImmA (M78 family)